MHQGLGQRHLGCAGGGRARPRARVPSCAMGHPLPARPSAWSCSRASAPGFITALSILDINRLPRYYVNTARLLESLGVAGAMCLALPSGWHCPRGGTAPGTAFPGSTEGGIPARGGLDAPPGPRGPSQPLSTAGLPGQCGIELHITPLEHQAREFSLNYQFELALHAFYSILF